MDLIIIYFVCTNMVLFFYRKKWQYNSSILKCPLDNKWNEKKKEQIMIKHHQLNYVFDKMSINWYTSKVFNKQTFFHFNLTTIYHFFVVSFKKYILIL